MDTSPLLLFDGHCNLCNGAVDFVIRRDKKGVFKFASLQSEIGQKILSENKMPIDSFDTLILYENKKIYTHSTAVLRIAKKLPYWKIFYVLIIVPKFVRNFAYSFVARNRYKWFGKKETCRLPTPAERARFL